MEGRRFVRAVVWLLPVLLIGWFVRGIYRGAAQKSATADVQGVELRHRDDHDKTSPLVVRNELGRPYVMLGLPSGNRDFPRDWIILNATPGGSMVKMPEDGRFELTCAYLASVQRQVEIVAEVDKFLAARCHP